MTLFKAALYSSVPVAVWLHHSTTKLSPVSAVLSWAWGSRLIYLQRVLRWDRSSIINVGYQTLAWVFIGPSTLDLRHFHLPGSLAHSAAGRACWKGSISLMLCGGSTAPLSPEPQTDLVINMAATVGGNLTQDYTIATHWHNILIGVGG